jgi:hypothetical protein
MPTQRGILRIGKQNIARAIWGPAPGRCRELFSPCDCPLADLSVAQGPARPFASQRFQSAAARNGAHRNAVATNCFEGPTSIFPVIAEPPHHASMGRGGACGATWRPETRPQYVLVVSGSDNDDAIAFWADKLAALRGKAQQHVVATASGCALCSLRHPDRRCACATANRPGGRRHDRSPHI